MAIAAMPGLSPLLRAVHATAYARGNGTPWGRFDEAMTLLRTHVTT